MKAKSKDRAIKLSVDELMFLEAIVSQCVLNGRSPFFFMLHEKLVTALRQRGPYKEPENLVMAERLARVLYPKRKG